MLEDALDFADLAEQFSKQDNAKQGEYCDIINQTT